MVSVLDNMGAFALDMDGVRQTAKSGVDGPGGEAFDDILQAQEQPQASQSGEMAKHEPGAVGGNSLQGGGKGLPEPGPAEPGPAEPGLAEPGLAEPNDSAVAPLDLADLPAILPGVESSSVAGAAPRITAGDANLTTGIQHQAYRPGEPVAMLPDNPLATLAGAGAESALTGQVTGTAANEVPAVAIDEKVVNAATALAAPADPAAIAATSPLAFARGSQGGPLDPVGMPVSDDVSAALSAGPPADHAGALSKLMRPVDSSEAGLRNGTQGSSQVVSPGDPQKRLQAGYGGAGDRAAVTGIAELPLATRADPVPATSESSRGAETIQAKLPAAVPAQPIIGGIQLPTGEADLAVGRQTAAPSVLAAPLGDPSWNTEVAARVSVMVRNGLQEATLQLSPPELGRLEVKIATEGDQTKILFTVSSADTRELIEQALPRLREMLGQGGLQLSRFDVADHPQSGAGQGDVFDESSAQAATDGDGTPDESMQNAATSAPVSLVDYYV